MRSLEHERWFAAILSAAISRKIYSMAIYSKVAIIGVGLIGGSIGKALLVRKKARAVVGCGRNEAKLQAAKAAGLITDITTEIAVAAADADVVVVCTPVDMIADQIIEASKHCLPATLLTDAGSIKQAIFEKVEAADITLGRFIGSHPMAGSEKGGCEFAEADLFENRLTILTPSEHTDPRALVDLQDFWASLGSETVTMSPAAHDESIAAVSHVPHLIASVLAAATSADDLPFSSTGFADTTRVAGGSVELWRQILLGNRAAALKGLANFERLLTQMRRALEDEDSAAVADLLQQGKAIRDALGSRNPPG